MPEKLLDWQIKPPVFPPEWFIQAVRRQAPGLPGHHAAQLLWQRGICQPEQLAGFLDLQQYQPASPDEFGPEMQAAVERLQQARNQGEVVAIWGDFDADGLTATAVLWEGLGEFFARDRQLFYTIPNRLTESHGLSMQGIDALVEQGCHLIVTCDTGSTNLSEIDYAQSLGLDVIVTDHHTLPAERPPVAAIINPRYLATEHPLFHLSGVAVAYKLVEALYMALPNVPQRPLEDLLDLVAIGLIADLVQLTGDCRYLAKRGIQKLEQQLTRKNRPGVARLLELCKKTGDRPTDISFGLGPRINAVSRIQGDARFCVELLTSRDVDHCCRLAAETELANSRRKALQKDVSRQVTAKLEQLDLSTTSVIVLADDQWPLGVLGLVAAQVAQEQGRPTILLSTDLPNSGEQVHLLARGSARSVNQIDLYQLVKDQAHLLHRFGGHPFAAGLSLPVANLTLFTEAINWQLRQHAAAVPAPAVQADLTVTVADLAMDLGKSLFTELKLLEPCGLGNPVPRLLIRNCWFSNARHQNIQDVRGNKIRYIKTLFTIRDDTTESGFPGVWWEHYQEDLPQGRCDAVVELDHNSYTNKSKGQKPHYQLRLIAVRPCTSTVSTATTPINWILDWRQGAPDTPKSTVLVDQCPTSWNDWQPWFRQAVRQKQQLAIAYLPPEPIEPTQLWKQLIGIAKYLKRTGTAATYTQLQEKLRIGELPLQLGLQALALLGFEITYFDHDFEIAEKAGLASSDAKTTLAIERFLAAVQEEQFRRQYFYQVSLTTIQATAISTTPLEPEMSYSASSAAKVSGFR